MIKASEGGGGKGIRKAESDDEFQKQYPQVFFKHFNLKRGNTNAGVVRMIWLSGHNLNTRLIKVQYSEESFNHVFVNPNLKQDLNVIIVVSCVLLGA